jgi:hypothetical protein
VLNYYRTERILVCCKQQAKIESLVCVDTMRRSKRSLAKHLELVQLHGGNKDVTDVRATPIATSVPLGSDISRTQWFPVTRFDFRSPDSPYD